MLMRLARQTYVRQYGEYTYLFGKVTAFDEMFRDAEPFMRFLTREPQERDAIIDKIFALFTDVDRATVAADFDAFMAPLIEQKVVLVGESSEALIVQEPIFTYDCDDPKTLEDKKNLTPEEPDQVYVGYEAPEGMRLLVMEGEIRNLGKEDLKIDTLGFFSQYPFLALAYCDEGLYQGILVMGSADGKTLVDELPAGATQRCYVFFSVPEKAARTKDPVALFFGCSDFSDDVFLGTGNLRYDGTAIEWERCDFLAFWAFSETASVKNSCDA